MSKIVEAPVKIFESAIGAVEKVVSGIGGEKPEAPGAGAAAQDLVKKEDPGNAKIDARAGEFATREQKLGQRAAAAGAQRSENDADLLGYTPAKKRSASRALLG